MLGDLFRKSRLCFQKAPGIHPSHHLSGKRRDWGVVEENELVRRAALSRELGLGKGTFDQIKQVMAGWERKHFPCGLWALVPLLSWGTPDDLYPPGLWTGPVPLTPKVLQS